MSTQLQTTGKDLKGLLDNPMVQEKIKNIVGRNSATFTTSVIQIASQNEMLAKADPNSILGAAITAATLDLPLNNSLGFAYIVPYSERQRDGSYRVKANFQLGAKGYIQLAQRSGQFKRLHATDVKEGEIASRDRLTGEMEFNFIADDREREKAKTIGYVAFFKLLNGYEDTLYMSIEELNAHAKKFSQTFKSGFGVWKDNFDAMATKTVVKLLLSKKAPLSTALQTAITTDQATFNDAENTEDISYIDNNENPEHDPEAERLRILIEGIENQDDIDFVRPHVSEEYLPLFKQKLKEVNEKQLAGAK